MSLRVLHVAESLCRSAGSVAHLLLDFFAAADSHGVRSLAVTHEADPAEPEAVDLHLLACPPDQAVRTPQARELAERLIDQADVVHLHGLWCPLNVLFAELARRRQRPYVISPHGRLMPDPGQAWGWQRRWAEIRHRRAMFRPAACLLAFSTAERDELQSRGLNRRVELLPLGVNTYLAPGGAPPAELDSLAGRRCLLVLGPIDQAEGVAEFLRGCQTLSAGLEPWLLVFAGPQRGDCQAMLEAGLRRKGVLDRVAFVCQPDLEAQRSLLGRAALVVLPTPRHQPPVSALQAMAAGVPVLVSSLAGLAEVESFGAGRVTPPGFDSMREALAELVALPAERLQQMGRRAAELARTRYDWQQLVGRYVKLYRSLL